jgi:hypothetical protein
MKPAGITIAEDNRNVSLHVNDKPIERKSQFNIKLSSLPERKYFSPTQLYCGLADPVPLCLIW